MYAEIIVKTNIPSIGKTYTYRIPQELAYLAIPGRQVTVSFGKRQTEGVIFAIINKKPTFKTKDIITISPSAPVLPPSSLDIAEWLSIRYSCNFYECIQALLPRNENKRESKVIPSSTVRDKPPILTPKQQQAVKTIQSKKTDMIFLLHGITGSGKTEVYLHIAANCIQEGKQVLFLVPEISLTPQLIERFSMRFGGDELAIVHSRVSNTIRAKTWKQIQEGTKSVIIGSRSAILSPFHNLGAIIIDECHEQSYKQDKNPKYNAIELAKYIARRDNLILVLGSATPLIEQYYDCLHGSISLIELPDRIKGTLPKTIVIDAKEKTDKNNYSIISKELLQQVESTLNKSEQVILYLNRRGLRSGLLCTNCGNYENCPKCNMPLTLHKKKDKFILVCHYCFFTKQIPEKCSTCGSRFLKGTGYGTQAILHETQRLFPNTNAIVMDKDTTSKKGSHEKIFKSFENKEAGILIGTQMITKGWDISNVSLTGYLLLDSDLLFPSYRTSERVYQLITQLSGRAGRGDKPGTSVIQTYNPQNPILLTALKNNYRNFYEQEVQLREKLEYPPFVNLIQVIAKDSNETKAFNSIKTLTNALVKNLTETIGNHSFSLLGPSKCFLSKVNNTYFFQSTIKIKIMTFGGDKSKHTPSRIGIENENFEKAITIINRLPRPAGVSINIDPFDLL